MSLKSRVKKLEDTLINRIQASEIINRQSAVDEEFKRQIDENPLAVLQILEILIESGAVKITGDPDKDLDLLKCQLSGMKNCEDIQSFMFEVDEEDYKIL